MTELEKKIELLLARQITKTRFATITVPVNNKGIAIGQGKCKAVILHLNFFVLDTSDTLQGTERAGGIYYGDQNQQTCELLQNSTNADARGINNRSSNIIFCNDLSEVWVRGKPKFNDVVTPYQLELIIYE